MELHDGFYACHAVFLYVLGCWARKGGCIRLLRGGYQPEIEYIGHFMVDIGQKFILSVT